MIIEVSCLPELDEDQLKALYGKIVKATVKGRFGVRKDEITVSFPKDSMKYGLGEEIIIKLFIRLHNDWAHWIPSNICENVGKTVNREFLEAKVESFVVLLNQGYWCREKREEEFRLKLLKKTGSTAIHNALSRKLGQNCFNEFKKHRKGDIPGIGEKRRSIIKQVFKEMKA
jgi:hypothetical protein